MERRKILKDLVSINTVNDLENNKFISYVNEYLKRLDFKTRTIGKDKKCLIATYKKDFNLTFLGHSDTVNYTDNWNYKQLTLTKDKNNYYGLGVCDMKSGIAAFLNALNEIELDKLNKGIQVVITYDEEIGFSGIKELKNYYKDFSDNILIGEPSNLVPIVACKGCLEYSVKFFGKAVHSSLEPNGKNAIVECMKFINELLIVKEKLKKEENKIFKDIPYTTVNIGTIFGGTAINIVPDTCEIKFDFRTVFKEQNKELKTKINTILNKYNCTYEVITEVKSFTSKPNKIIEKITNKKSISYSYVTEGNFLEKENIFILGPGPVTAHEKDEYISIESYNKTVEIYKKIIKTYCGKDEINEKNI